MRLSTRLLAALLPTVALVMFAYGALALRQRQATLVPAAQRETEAYATALGLALEPRFRGPPFDDVQDVINEVSREPKIYGILVYDSTGRPLLVSDPLRTPSSAPRQWLEQVLKRGMPAAFEREIEDTRVYSVLRPIHDRRGRVVAALEVAQPLSLLETEMTSTTQRLVLNTLTLFAALIVVTLWLVRRFVRRPLDQFLGGVGAVGRGELAHRLDDNAGPRELADLAREFNRMAGHLELARERAVRERQELMALERRLRETEKLAAVGNLAAGLAHEIAAPLNVISGRAEMLVAAETAPPDRERNVRIIVEQIHRISRTVRSLLDFARHREPELRPVDLTALLDRVAEFLDGEFVRRGVRLERTGARAARVFADADLLHQVFVILLLNALHAMEGTDGDRRLTVQVQQVLADVRVEVADSGPGIPAESLGKIFEAFYTTKDHGTGLGLVVARSIVEQHGGTLEGQNRTDGPGAVFLCTLPLAQEDGTRG